MVEDVFGVVWSRCGMVYGSEVSEICDVLW